MLFMMREMKEREQAVYICLCVFMGRNGCDETRFGPGREIQYAVGIWV